MTIDKAIKELQGSLANPNNIIGKDLREAMNLGIEALKEIKAAREYSVGLVPEKLPGETQ